MLIQDPRVQVPSLVQRVVILTSVSVSLIMPTILGTHHLNNTHHPSALIPPTITTTPHHTHAFHPLPES